MTMSENASQSGLDSWPEVADGVSPAALRNAAPIMAVARDLLHTHVQASGLVLEIAAGGGYHACICARAFPAYRWQPTEADAAGVAAMAPRIAAAGLPNLAAPLRLDVTAQPWPVPRADAIVCINMIHIAPWAATSALFAGAARVLPTGGLVITYGPYRIAGDYQADSNRAFDDSLRSRNPAWGLRDMHDVAAVANDAGFDHILTQPMPANNHILAFKKR
jgi:cyclopropane fatty-acyl-phospholipid synthase-like methyltransferase